MNTWMAIAVLMTLMGFAAISVFFVRNSLDKLPSVDELGQYVPPLVTNIVDIHGMPVGEFFTERRTTVPMNKIPVDIRNAVIATEDTDFYTHWGIDPGAILRAAFAKPSTPTEIISS
jgi:penicillin-binding protein 1A